MSSLCPNKDRCGSCAWSHIPYEKQLKQKLSDINGSFKLKHLDVVVDEIFASPKTEHYRNRMDFVISFRGEVGLREKGKWWRVIDDHTCFLADERIDAMFPHIREWAQTCGLACWDRKTYAGTLRYAVVRATSTGETMITVVTSAPREGKSTGVQKMHRIQQTRELVTHLVDEYCTFYGVVCGRVSVRDQRSRWGSCSSAGNLNFNYKLAVVPEHIADYVIVHELCHCKEFNHSPRFWKLVEQTIPNHKEIRKQLRSF